MPLPQLNTNIDYSNAIYKMLESDRQSKIDERTGNFLNKQMEVMDYNMRDDNIGNALKQAQIEHYGTVNETARLAQAAEIQKLKTIGANKFAKILDSVPADPEEYKRAVPWISTNYKIPLEDFLPVDKALVRGENGVWGFSPEYKTAIKWMKAQAGAEAEPSKYKSVELISTTDPNIKRVLSVPIGEDYEPPAGFTINTENKTTPKEEHYYPTASGYKTGKDIKASTTPVMPFVAPLQPKPAHELTEKEKLEMDKSIANASMTALDTSKPIEVRQEAADVYNKYNKTGKVLVRIPGRGPFSDYFAGVKLPKTVSLEDIEYSLQQHPEKSMRDVLDKLGVKY